MKRQTGYKKLVRYTDLDTKKVTYDIAIFTTKSKIIKGVQFATDIIKGVAYEDLHKHGKKLNNNWINDCLIFLPQKTSEVLF